MCTLLLLNHTTSISNFCVNLLSCKSEVESLRTSLASKRPRGQILKSLASKVKSLASRPEVLENWPVLGSRTVLVFELLKFCGDRLKNICEDLFFFFFSGEHLCPWPRECLPSKRLSLASDFFCVLGLEPCVLDSTSAANAILSP